MALVSSRISLIYLGITASLYPTYSTTLSFHNSETIFWSLLCPIHKVYCHFYHNVHDNFKKTFTYDIVSDLKKNALKQVRILYVTYLMTVYS